MRNRQKYSDRQVNKGRTYGEYMFKPTHCKQKKICQIMSAKPSYLIIIFPLLAGIETFKGQYFHSRDYKNPESFTGKRVIIIGIGNSGGDLAVEISHVAKQVWISKLFTFLHQESYRWTQQRVWIPTHSSSVPMANGLHHCLIWQHWLMIWWSQGCQLDSHHLIGLTLRNNVMATDYAHNPNQLFSLGFEEDQIIDGRACQNVAFRSMYLLLASRSALMWRKAQWVTENFSLIRWWGNVPLQSPTGRKEAV